MLGLSRPEEREAMQFKSLQKRAADEGRRPRFGIRLAHSSDTRGE